MRFKMALLIAFLVLCCGPMYGTAMDQANSSDKEINFVVLSDLHLGLNETNNTYKMFHYNDQILRDAVAQINNMKNVSFVLISGDLTKDSEPYNHQRVIEILGNLKVPYFITPGNHDVLKKDLPANAWGAEELRKNYHMPWHNDSLSYSADPVEGLHIISLDSASDKSHLGDWGGAISTSDLKWLGEDLANNTGKTAIVMTHHALNWRMNVSDKLYYVDNAEQVKKLLNKYGVHLAITGHIHITDINRNGTLIDRSSPALCSYPCAYTIYHLSGKELGINTFWYGNQTVLAIAKKELIDAKKDISQAEGMPTDRNATLKFESNVPRKNVILMIGDGMGFAQLTAGRWEKAGENLTTYRKTSLNMDHMEYDGYVSTNSANSFITDSAAAITAISTGQKSVNDVLNQDHTAVWKKKNGSNLTTIAEIAKKAGYAIGAITTTRITHATPAGFYAHINDRDNEAAIAEQLIDSEMDVAMGGGYKFFIGKSQITPFGGKSKRTDSKDLINNSKAQGYTFVYNESALKSVDANRTDMLLGIFDDDHMLYEQQRVNQTKNNEPSLAEMTEKAIEVLSKNPKGFLLMVEGGRIDHASHARSYSNTTADTLAFDEAVKVAQDFQKLNNNTLIIVTADHETGGLDLGAKNATNYPEGMTPFFGAGVLKINGTTNNYTLTSEAPHSGVDVPIMASGPRAEKVSNGRMDNTQIFGLIKEALGL
jgi:alkaline phosphatase